MNIEAGYAAAAADGRLTTGSGLQQITSVTIDSRTVEEGSLYIPIVGEKHDGHSFIDAALQAGAAAFFYDPAHFDISGHTIPEGVAAIEVRDTCRALADLASRHRQDLGVKVIAVTGSVGKTTTKEFIYSALSVKFRTSKTKGNLNNKYGVPLTLLSIPDGTEYAIVEMGMNHFGEIEELSRIARPDYAVITNIGVAHIENLGNRRGVFRAKMEIVKGMGETGILVVNGDDDMLATVAGNVPQKVVTFGTQGNCDRTAHGIENTRSGVTFVTMNHRFNISIPGTHNVYDAMAAITVGDLLGIAADEMVPGIESCKGEANRMQVTEKDGTIFINDAYNANPVSMKAAIDTLVSMPCAGRRIAVLGDMKELGEDTADMHREIGAYCVTRGVDVLVSVGEQAGAMKAGAGESGGMVCMTAPDIETAAGMVLDIYRRGDTLIFKGSRAMRMEDCMKMVLEGQKQ